MGPEEFSADELRDELLFWEGLDVILQSNCQSHELIDDALRTYLEFTQTYKDEYLHNEDDVARCSYKLLDSALFATHKDYVRRQIIYSLLQEDDPAQVHLVAAFLLFDGKQHEATFEDMNREEAFPRLLELIEKNEYGDPALHRILLQLLYEMSRWNRVKPEELMLIEDRFVVHLLQIIETLSDDVGDPYHYPVIQVLLVLNEQYMVSAHDPTLSQAGSEMLPNKIINMLAEHGSAFKTFGENIILLLNRESETSLQLLILKLLYLIFTTPATYDYFYTNDLRVLVDVVIRNLLDLPHSSSALRHTYLRVLHPLLAHTQLAEPDAHYKREELLKVLALLTGVGLDGTLAGPAMAHFGAADETTKRLGARCASVPWLRGMDGDGIKALPIRPAGESISSDEQTTPPAIIKTDTTLEDQAEEEANQSKPESVGATNGTKEKKSRAPKRPPPRKGSSAAKAQIQQAIEKVQREAIAQQQMPVPMVTTSALPSSVTISPNDSPSSTNKRRPEPPPARRLRASKSPSPTPSSRGNPSARRARSANRPTPSPPPPRKGSSATRYLALGATNANAAESSLSVAAVAMPRAKPGVLTPSLRRGDEKAVVEGRREEMRGRSEG